MSPVLNFSPSCERNKHAICSELQTLIKAAPRTLEQCHVLEVGSLSGQHAIHFSQQLERVVWQTSDIEENHLALQTNINNSGIGNCLQPLALDVSLREHWPETYFDIVYTANTLHIMSWWHVEQFFNNVSKVLKPGSILCVYGPFKYDGTYTSESNAQFQQWLIERDDKSGIRDFEEVNRLALQQGLVLLSDKIMPANNQLLSWKYTGR